MDRVGIELGQDGRRQGCGRQMSSMDSAGVLRSQYLLTLLKWFSATIMRERARKKDELRQEKSLVSKYSPSVE